MFQTDRLWLTRLADFFIASTLAIIFIIFLLQIFARYAPNLAPIVPLTGLSEWLTSIKPIGWTVNLISLLWVWLIFVGCALALNDKEHVVFDVFALAMPTRVKRVFKLIIAIVVVAAMLASLAPMWDAIFGNRLMELKKIQTLRVPFTGDKIAVKWLFAPYVLLMIALVVRYSCYVVSVLRGDPDVDSHDV
jgi:TRAP-type C4-dicarboxylate transport system permease small subunit